MEKEDIFNILHTLHTPILINLPNIRAETPLHYASMGAASPLTLIFLLQHGAQADVHDVSGLSPLDILEFREQSAAMDIIRRFEQQDSIDSESHAKAFFQYLNILKAKKLIEPPSGSQVPLVISGKFGTVRIRSEELLSDFNPMKKNDAGSLQRFLNDKKLYQAACSYPILPNREPVPHLDSDDCSSTLRIQSVSDFLEAIYYPGWTDQVVRCLLLIRPKYFVLEEIFERVVADSLKFSYLLRVVYLWIEDFYDNCLSLRPRCLDTLKGLLNSLETQFSSLSVLETRLRDTLLKVISIFLQRYPFEIFFVQKLSKMINYGDYACLFQGPEAFNANGCCLSDLFDTKNFVYQLNMVSFFLFR
jgi:hypothetical protein